MNKKSLLSFAAVTSALLVNHAFAGLTNGDFETGDFTGWNSDDFPPNTIGTVGPSNLSNTFLTTSTNADGAAEGFSFSGIFQDLAASAGQTWTFTGDGVITAAEGSFFAHLKIEWLDSADGLIAPVTVLDGAIFDNAIESNRLTSVGSATTAMSVAGVAPAGTVKARFLAFAVAEDQDSQVDSITFSADNLVAAVPEPSALLGALTALSLGGLLLRRRRE